MFPGQKLAVQSLNGAITLANPSALSQKHCDAYSTPARESSSKISTYFHRPRSPHKDKQLRRKDKRELTSSRLTSTHTLLHCHPSPIRKHIPIQYSSSDGIDVASLDTVHSDRRHDLRVHVRSIVIDGQATRAAADLGPVAFAGP